MKIAVEADAHVHRYDNRLKNVYTYICMLVFLYTVNNFRIKLGEKKNGKRIHSQVGIINTF